MTILPLIANLTVAAALSVPGAPAASAVAPAQIPQAEGHYHEGEFGEKYLLIEQHLKCNCGCGLDVHSCQFQMQCGTSPVWSERIRTELEAGQSMEAIEASFVAEFGPTVLMSPPAQGFNLVGYLLPAFAIITAGMLVGLVIRGGAHRREAPVAARDLSDEEQARLADELRRLEQAESPDW